MTDPNPIHDADPYALEPCAALDFEPWNLKEAAWSPPSNMEWCQLANPFLITTHLAWKALGMTKAELMGTVATGLPPWEWRVL